MTRPLQGATEFGTLVTSCGRPDLSLPLSKHPKGNAVVCIDPRCCSSGNTRSPLVTLAESCCPHDKEARDLTNGTIYTLEIISVSLSRTSRDKTVQSRRRVRTF